MCLKQIPPSFKREEEKIQKKISLLIDDNKSLIFNSGAGAGKTYALIESLKYIVSTRGKTLAYQNQSIACITYTNVAANEVKERLGNTSIVVTSTIHTRIWEIIKPYRKLELVQLHKEKLRREVVDLEQILESEKCKEYAQLTKDKQGVFDTLVSKNKELYRVVRNKSAAEVKSVLNEEFADFHDVLHKSVSRFKKTFDTITKIKRYGDALKNIEEKKPGFAEVTYTDNYNLDVLHRMRISHDTLLEYGFSIISRYNVLKKIIIDKYPYFLVDEYQDTSELVVKILVELLRYAKKNNLPFFVAFFGDRAQNIYDTNAGTELSEYSDSFVLVNKQFNRRSTQEVISVINKIRKDEIVQKSIFADSAGGSVEFYKGTDVQSFVKKCSADWFINNDNQLHCFVLTNETVAAYSGFEDVYDCFKNSGRYKAGLSFKQITTETLSDDITKLGQAQLVVFKLIYFILCIKDIKISLEKTLINKPIYQKLNFSQLQNLILTLQKIEGKTLGEFATDFLDRASKEPSNVHLQLLVDELFGEGKQSLDFFKNILIDYLVGDENTVPETKSCVDNLFNCSIHNLSKWANYILRNWTDSVVYHTYHGTKGLEFNNVAIIMENDFGRSRNFFNNLFSNIADIEQNRSARNLLYVACSRAIKNLRILYLDSVSDFEDSIKDIFGGVKTVY